MRQDAVNNFVAAQPIRHKTAKTKMLNSIFVQISQSKIEGSKSNQSLIVLNFPFVKEDSNSQQHHDSQPISISWDREVDKLHSKCQGMIKIKMGMLWCTGRF